MAKKIALLLGCLIIMVGTLYITFNNCEGKNWHGLYKLNTNEITGHLKKFVDNYSKENGVYIYESDDGSYILINGINVKQGEPAAYYTNTTYVEKANVMLIDFEERFSKDYMDEELEHRLLFKILSSKEVDTMEVNKNGKGTDIMVVVNKSIEPEPFIVSY